MTVQEGTSHGDEPGEIVDEYRLLRAAEEAAVEPWALLQAVREPGGRISDFIYHDINPVAARQQRLRPEDLIGRSVADSLPEVARIGLIEKYAHCVETGEPLILDDLSYYGRTLDEPGLHTRRYEMRGVRVETDYLSLSWRDVNQRFVDSEYVLQARERLRASADAMLDPQVLLEAVRNSSGKVVDFAYREVNKATCDYLGLAREDLLGRGVVETMPGIEATLLAGYIRCMDTGEPLVLNDFSYDNEILADTRRYDIRATRATANSITLTWRDVTDRFQAAQDALAAKTLLQATVDSMLNPQALLEAVRDPAGSVVDFVYRSVNRAFCSYRGWEERDIIGTSVLKAQPNLVDTGLFVRYVCCVDTGEAVVLDDFHLLDSILGDHRRFDIRVVRAGADLISLTFADVTDRSHAAQRIAASEEKYRLLALNSTDVIIHGRDGKVVWASPSVTDVLGGSPDYWIGRSLKEVVPADQEVDFDARQEALAEGRAVQSRTQLVALDGTRHWMHVHSKPFHDLEGRRDGFTASLRVIDDEVAAEQAADQARREQSRADALYRRSVESSAVGMCLADLAGNFVEVNAALCEFFGYDAETLKHLTWQELTDPDYLQADLDNRAELLAGTSESYRLLKKFIHADGHPIWGDLAVSCIRDDTGHVEIFIGQITDITAEMQAREQLENQNELIAASEANYRLLAENSADVVVHTGEDDKVVWISPNVDSVLGRSVDYWIGRDPLEVIPSEDRDAYITRRTAIHQASSFQGRVRFIGSNGLPYWCHVNIKPFYDAAGHRDGAVTAIRVIDNEVAAEQALEEARRQQERADEIYRRSMSDASLAMVIATPEGRIQESNEAMCRMAGLDAQTLIGMHFRDFGWVPEELAEQQKAVDDIAAGTIDSYRMLRTYFDPAGQPIWGDMSTTGIRDEGGRLEFFIITVSDVTARVEADDRNRALAQQLQQQTDRVKSELDSAASYMSSLMPTGLQGPVTVSSRYLPSRELGGDCIDYYWIDDDHLLVKLIDVSGHGIEPALLAVSVHNLMRSGSIARETLLEPEAVLTELNRLFAMEQQNDHYFTMWYGIYELSTRILRYASAGSTPALAFNSAAGTAVATTALSTPAAPIGLFDDTEYTSRTYHVPLGCRLLIYSDGASEINLADGKQLKDEAFNDLTSRVAASPNWSLDDLIEQLRALTQSGAFDDDCSLIQVAFD